ncbi:hypothetical protein U1Q18_004877 [Sarracenia purpurea var. burkii]
MPINPVDSFESLLISLWDRRRCRILRSYLQHIHTVSDEIEWRRRQLDLSLASSHPGLKDHKLFPQVGVTLSPAEINEIMIANQSSPSRALKSAITAIRTDLGRGVR